MNADKDDSIIVWKILFWCFVVFIATTVIHDGLGVNADNILRVVGATNRAGLLDVKDEERQILQLEQIDNLYRMQSLRDEITRREGACERVTFHRATMADYLICNAYTALGGSTHYAEVIENVAWRNGHIELEIELINLAADRIEEAAWWDLLMEPEQYD